MSITWMCDKLCSFKGIELNTDELDERPPFLKDYGSIIHRYRFRRLSNKAQVYLNPVIDFPRTRLTHSIEVEQISRELSRFFTREIQINNVSFHDVHNNIKNIFSNNFEDLVSASCLAHDIGQAPFGHKGEKTLNDLMKEDGVKAENCFEANKQNVRVLLGNKARKPYGVSCALIDSIMKYKSDFFGGKQKFPGHYEFERNIVNKISSFTKTEGVRNPACYIMEASDDLAYISSDLQDALRLNLIEPEKLSLILKNIELPERLMDIDKNNWESFIDDAIENDNFDKLTSLLLKVMIDSVKDNLKRALRTCSKSHINELPTILNEFLSNDDCSLNILYFGFGKVFKELKEKIYMGHILSSRDIIKTELLAKKVIIDLWSTFKINLLDDNYQKTDLFKIIPEHVQKNINKAHDESFDEQKYQYIADYISGMTDRYAIFMWEQLFNPSNLKHL